MAANSFQEDTYINSIIGEGTRLRGEFNLNGLLRIDGDFQGVVKTTGKVLVGSNGRAECTIYGSTVVIGGAVRGNVFASEKVIILSTGIVLGNIKAPKLIMEEGVLFNGSCRIEPAEVKARVADIKERNEHNGNVSVSGSVMKGLTEEGIHREKNRERKLARVIEKRAF